ncbi:MAG TPA: TraR/DksA family transcriptional regulator [Gemmataceae bacterium]|jgi:DnaK suppressor protein|nr:TraR/DksA family transcriptional regulator [Gemmataceae bacterium]
MARRDALLRLHKTLTARRNELRKRLGTDLADLGHKGSSASGDAADVAFGASGEELSSQLAELEAKELNQIERALVRLKQGTYGLCEACGAKIPVARMNVLPYSTLCIKCQRESETNSNWLLDRRSANWEAVSDGGGHDDREVRLSDLEMAYGK